MSSEYDTRRVHPSTPRLRSQKVAESGTLRLPGSRIGNELPAGGKRLPLGEVGFDHLERPAHIPGLVLYVLRHRKTAPGQELVLGDERGSVAHQQPEYPFVVEQFVHFTLRPSRDDPQAPVEGSRRNRHSGRGTPP